MNEDARADAELLAATERGDGAAFAVLVRRYIRSATLLAAQLLEDRDEAEDIVQDAFTVVHRRARTFDPARPFGPWVFAIVRRLAANRRARDARRAGLLELFGMRELAEPPSMDGEEAILARLDGAAALRAMNDLSPMQRACIELVVLRGLTTQEVAAMHGVSESTVRQHVFRARASLRNVLGDQGGTDDG
ncbi:MAG TPA: RNA polymerase sigma factor [Gemmatimonadaceae bacterium]|nr:RNA polymerase sigma factor [Gemmatimonadaceae bacterium]